MKIENILCGNNLRRECSPLSCEQVAERDTSPPLITSCTRPCSSAKPSNYLFRKRVRRHFVPTTNCPTFSHATNCPSDKMPHFLPGDKMSHWCSRKKHCFTGIFRATNCPMTTKCPTFSPATKCPNLCTYAKESYGKFLGRFVASEKGYWDKM